MILIKSSEKQMLRHVSITIQFNPIIYAPKWSLMSIFNINPVL